MVRQAHHPEPCRGIAQSCSPLDSARGPEPAEGLLSTNCQLVVPTVGVKFEVPIQIVPPALRSVPNSDRDREDRIPPRLQRLPDQSHGGVFRHATAFPVVTPPARGHDVLPGLPSAFRDRDDMIEREVLGPELLVTILAGITVAGEDVDAQEINGPVEYLKA